MIRVLDEEGNPVVGSLLVAIRDIDRQSDRSSFRTALRRIGTCLAFEIGARLPACQVTVKTPLGVRSEPVLESEPVLVVILRAGLLMWEGFCDVFPDSDSTFVGAARSESSVRSESSGLAIDIGYIATGSLLGRTVIYVDPMLATGSTIRQVHSLLIAQTGQPKRVIVAGAVGYRKALEMLERELSADIFVASADDELDAASYIVPGLGDAGDLAFGWKL